MRRIGQLEVTEKAVGVPGGGLREITGDAEAVWEHVRSDDLGRYRPLSGAKTLPTGWTAPLGERFDAEAAIDAIYPLALVHQRQLAAGTLRVVTLDEVLRRQSGRYETTSSLSETGRARAVDTLCRVCVRQPVWAGAETTVVDIPCPEPCSAMVAFCREAALWEVEPPERAEPDPAVAWAAFEEPGNELRERYLKEMVENG